MCERVHDALNVIIDNESGGEHRIAFCMPVDINSLIIIAFVVIVVVDVAVAINFQKISMMLLLIVIINLMLIYEKFSNKISEYSHQ
jgi:hypothetical protein